MRDHNWRLCYALLSECLALIRFIFSFPHHLSRRSSSTLKYYVELEVIWVFCSESTSNKRWLNSARKKILFRQRPLIPPDKKVVPTSALFPYQNNEDESTKNQRMYEGERAYESSLGLSFFSSPSTQSQAHIIRYTGRRYCLHANQACTIKLRQRQSLTKLPPNEPNRKWPKRHTIPRNPILPHAVHLQFCPALQIHPNTNSHCA